MKEKVVIYNRKEQMYEDGSQYAGEALDILYNTWGGRILLKFLIHPAVSALYGLYNDSRISKKRIEPFVRKNNIRMEDYVQQEYRCFNDFFTRKVKEEKRPVSPETDKLVAPADCKISAYTITKDKRIRIKGVEYTLEELVNHRLDLKGYEGGECLVFRLSVDDYHRYIFLDHGKVTARFPVKGKLHTVCSISKEYKIYRENTRVINRLETENFGQVIMIEVGALLVGRIVNYPIKKFAKGMEKGYFKVGGSTIVMLFQKDAVVLDQDIREKIKEGVEVKVFMGEVIGSKKG